MDDPDCDSTWEDESEEDGEDGQADDTGDADTGDEDGDAEETRPGVFQVQEGERATPGPQRLALALAAVPRGRRAQAVSDRAPVTSGQRLMGGSCVGDVRERPRFPSCVGGLFSGCPSSPASHVRPPTADGFHRLGSDLGLGDLGQGTTCLPLAVVTFVAIKSLSPGILL